MTQVELGQVFQLADFVWKVGEGVVVEIEDSQRRQSRSDVRRDGRQLVRCQDKLGLKEGDKNRKCLLGKPFFS